jgi:DNA-binding NarL/FixJ family response regulator
MARSVLIVDDSAPFRATARAVLQSRGYTVVGVAEDGAGALEAVRSLAPDAVLLDINLPDADGLAIAEELLRDGSSITVVLVSTLDAGALGDGVERCGARGFLPKRELASPRLVELLGRPDG